MREAFQVRRQPSLQFNCEWEVACPTTRKVNANEADAATNGQPSRADSAATVLLRGPTTEHWQDAINEMVKGARCLARRANNFRSVQQWASFADEVQNQPTDILWTEIVGGATTCSAMAARQRQQVENLAVIMRTYDSPGKVILVNHSVLTHDLGLHNSPYKFPQDWYDKNSWILESQDVPCSTLQFRHNSPTEWQAAEHVSLSSRQSSSFRRPKHLSLWTALGTAHFPAF